MRYSRATSQDARMRALQAKRKADSRAATIRRLVAENAELRATASREVSEFNVGYDHAVAGGSSGDEPSEGIVEDQWYVGFRCGVYDRPPVVLDKPDGPGEWWFRDQAGHTDKLEFSETDIADWDRGSYRQSFAGCKFQRVVPPTWPAAKKETTTHVD